MGLPLEKTQTFLKVQRLDAIMKISDRRERLKEMIMFLGKYSLWKSEHNENLAIHSADIIVKPAALLDDED